MNAMLGMLAALGMPRPKDQEPQSPDAEWDMPYDLFDSGGNLIHQGKNILQMTNPGGPGVRPLRGTETEENSRFYGGLPQRYVR